MPMNCVSVDIFCVQLENNYFDNKYYWNWSDAAAEIIFTIEKKINVSKFLGFIFFFV